MSGEPALWAAAGFAALAFALLSLFVRRAPLGIDRLPEARIGWWTGPAIALTRSGYASAIATISLIAAGVTLALHGRFAGLLAVVGAQVLSQAAVHAVKATLRRPRPDDWLFRRERGRSFPSGHASTAVAFYGGWAWLVAVTGLPLGVRVCLAVALLLWAAGIMWSRVALRAHFPSDVLGGALLGAAFLCAAHALPFTFDLDRAPLRG